MTKSEMRAQMLVEMANFEKAGGKVQVLSEGKTFHVNYMGKKPLKAKHKRAAAAAPKLFS